MYKTKEFKVKKEMSREVIFDFDYERIQNEKLKDVILKATSIRTENYSKVAEVLNKSPQLERVSVNVQDGNDQFWNNFFKVFMPQDGMFTMDPRNIELSGDVEKFNCDLYEYIENLELAPKSVGKINEIKDKFPNLKNIRLTDKAVKIEDIGDNIQSIFELAQYMKNVNFSTSIDLQKTKEFLAKEEFGQKFVLSDDGLCLINIDRISDIAEKPVNLRINARDIDRLGLEKLRSSGDKITLVINNVSELSNEDLQRYIDSGINLNGITIYSKENEQEQNETYDIQTYAAIRDKLEELVEGIDLNAPEKERFAEVYKRVCSSIVYDTPAAYPITKAQQEYSDQQESNCRNLRNGLLEGKCVCAGYADILRNALSMVNIEAEYTVGAVIEKTISSKKFKEDKYKGKFIDKKDDGSVSIGEYHAWNKIKLDGVWYNVDPTWDATAMRLGSVPTHCLKSDEEIKKKDKKADFKGSECGISVEQIEVDKMFEPDRMYIGKYKVPSIRDITAGIRMIGDAYAEAGRDLKNTVISWTEKIADTFRKDKPKRLNASKAQNSNNQSKSNTWDLNNWGIDSSEFRKETQNITKSTNENYAKQTNEKGFENEK